MSESNTQPEGSSNTKRRIKDIVAPVAAAGTLAAGLAGAVALTEGRLPDIGSLSPRRIDTQSIINEAKNSGVLQDLLPHEEGKSSNTYESRDIAKALIKTHFPQMPSKVYELAYSRPETITSLTYDFFGKADPEDPEAKEPLLVHLELREDDTSESEDENQEKLRSTALADPDYVDIVNEDRFDPEDDESDGHAEIHLNMNFTETEGDGEYGAINFTEISKYLKENYPGTFPEGVVIEGIEFAYIFDDEVDGIEQNMHIRFSIDGKLFEQQFAQYIQDQGTEKESSSGFGPATQTEVTVAEVFSYIEEALFPE